MDVKTITLAYPITVGGETITEVIFRRPKAKDMRLIARVEALRGDIEKGTGQGAEAEAEAALLLIRAVSGLSEAEVEELDLFDDIPTLSEEAGSFLEAIAPEAPKAGGE